MIRSRLLAQIPGVIHHFGDAATSDDDACAEVFGEAWVARPRKKQVHGIENVEVLRSQQECGDTDGIWTREKNIPLSVVTADCAPILLAAKDGSFIAAIHAGWRGTIAHIVSAFFRRSGVDAAEIVAVIGPCIGPCCYEVSAEIITQFQSEFPGVPIEPTPRRLDFKVAIVSELQVCGVPSSQIDVLPYCTFCSPGFCSYRRDGASARQVTVIARMDRRNGREGSARS